MDIYAGVVALWVIVFRMLSWRRKVLRIIFESLVNSSVGRMKGNKHLEIAGEQTDVERTSLTQLWVSPVQSHLWNFNCTDVRIVSHVPG